MYIYVTKWSPWRSLFDWSFPGYQMGIIMVISLSYKGEMKHNAAELRNPAAALTVAVSNPLY